MSNKFPELNARDGFYLGTLIGLIAHIFILKYIHKVILDAELRTDAYYDQEYDISDDNIK